MRWFLVWLIGSTTLIVSFVCLMILLVAGRVRRHHRVSPSIQTGAPLSWMVDPRSPARLHRRLARVGTVASAVAADHQPRRSVSSLGRKPQAGPMAETAAQLSAQAVEVDRRLAQVARLAPTARRRHLVVLAQQVEGLEQAAAQLSTLSAASLTPVELATDAGVLDVQGQLQRLTDARRELEALDAEAGLVTAPVGAPTAAPPSAPATGGTSAATR